MSHQFSDWYNETQPAVAPATLPFKVDGKRNSQTYKCARAILALSPAFTAVGAGDNNCRMMTVKKNDVLHGMRISSTGASTALTCDVGLYRVGDNHNGAVIDQDEFASALTLNDALGGVGTLDIFAEFAPAADSIRRGQPMWQIAGFSSAEDPTCPEEMEVALTATATLATANEPVTLELFGSFSP